MRPSILVFAVALTVGTTKARADLVNYNMSGTITSASSSSSFVVGDQITWTLQYNPSTPMTSGGANETRDWANYQMLHTNVITNIVDQTTGYYFPSLPPSNTWSVGMGLGNNNPTKYQKYYSGNILASQNAETPHITSVTSLSLSVYGYHSMTVNLAEFRFNKLPVVLDNVTDSKLFYNYLNFPNGDGPSFTASVDSIPGVVAYAPEPGSLTLFLLGAAGLAGYCMRRRLRLKLIMRPTILALTLILAAGTTHVHADMVYYNMTGTITDTKATVETSPANLTWFHLQHLSHPYATGDHISWTLRYDSSTPVANYQGGTNYNLLGATITNIVDQTTGYHFPVLSNSDTPSSTLTLSRYANPGTSNIRFSFEMDQGSSSGPEYGNGSSTQSMMLQLNSSSYWKETSLANLHLNTIPFAFGPPINHGYVGSYFNWGTDSYSYDQSIESRYVSNFGANVDSLTVSVASTPEPESLTLFLLGAAGLAACGIRRRLWQGRLTSCQVHEHPVN